MSEPLVVTLDVGTSSVRALAFDARGIAVPGAVSHLPHAPRTTVDGGVEFDAPEVLARCNHAMDAMHARLLRDGRAVVAVAMDTLVGNLLALDADGAPLTPVFTYADTRAAASVAALHRALDSAAMYHQTGVPLHSAYWPAQMRRLRDSRPDVAASATRWLTLGDYLAAQWTGRHACSYSVASWTGMLDRFALDWHSGLLDALGIRREQLSPLVAARDTQAGMLGAYAARWPLFKDARWFPAVGDGAAANIGSGCIDETSLAVTIGTSSAVRVVVPGTPDAIPPGLWCYRVDESRSLLGGALSEGGSIASWLRDVLGDAAPDEAELADAVLDSRAPVCLPLLAGERAPGWHAEARGTLGGLSLRTTPAEIMLAGLEGVALRLGQIANLLAPAVPGVRRVVGSGGGLLGSRLWRQIVADVLGRPLVASAEAEATSRGAALLALESLGTLSLAATAFGFGDTSVPDPARHAAYGEAALRQMTLYRQTVSDAPFAP
ncbi:MAG: gluconokinase [Chloroflexi bacterium]|nr:gluconokinase [Chloroflexota bacterium]